MGDAHKLEVAQFPDSGVQPDKPYTFLVRKNGAKGELDGKVTYRPSAAGNKRDSGAGKSRGCVTRDKSPWEREEASRK